MTMANQTARAMSNAEAEGLSAVLREAWQRPFYRAHWGGRSAEAVIAEVRAGGLSCLPLVRKSDLQAAQEEALCFDGAVDLVSSSGSTGRPLDIPLTAHEEQCRVDRIRRLVRAIGVAPGDRVLQLVSLNDLFSFGPLVWQAIKAEGACAIRCSVQRPQRVLELIRSARPRFVVGNPFAMQRMVEHELEGAHDAQLPARAILAVAATFDRDLRPTAIAQAVARSWRLEHWVNNYGTSEVGPIGYETLAHDGLVVHPENHVELVDPETSTAVRDPGRPGEVVVTALTGRRGFLPVRYATGDVAAWLRPAEHDAARSFRLGPIVGRLHNQLKLVGQTVFPELLLELVDRCDAVQQSAVVVRRSELGADEIQVLVVVRAGVEAQRAVAQASDAISRVLTATPEIRASAADEIQRLERASSAATNQVKIPRFFDLRAVR
jgi:phenylacetate-CoA ligase